jgi:PPE-repeat protein
MLWHAMPPELNTARLMAGAGQAPMLQAAAGWEALAAAQEAQAAELAAKLAALKGAWTGIGSERATAAAAPMVTWLETAAQTARKRGMQAAAQAAAYANALGITPSLPDIATNKITHTVLAATNFLGINTVPIGFNEMDYFVRMWNQAGGAMDIYEAETLANTVFEPLPEMKPIVAPGVGEAEAAQALSAFSQVASENGAAALQAATEAAATFAPNIDDIQQVTQLMTGFGQLSGPMQQLLQPLQQLASMGSQFGGMGGGSTSGDGLAVGGGKVGTESAQIGLLGASPLSNHPLLGGSGPSVGMGLMHAETLPGAGGSGPRTSMMSQLIDKPGPGVSPAGAGAGSSAMGGAAPMGAMGQGSQSGAASKPGLSLPGALAEQDDEAPHDVDDGDDW